LTVTGIGGMLELEDMIMNKIKKILVVCRMTSHCGPVVQAAAAQGSPCST